MTIEAEPMSPPVDPAKSRTRTFRKYQPIVRFTPTQTRRQNDLLRCAWQSLKTKDAVIAFLNTHNKKLGGEPLALALASDEGLLRAETLLGQMRSSGREQALAAE